MMAAAESWETLDAEAAMSGVDLLALPPVRLCNIVWARVRANSDDEDWQKFVTKITRPLPGRKPTNRLREFRRRVLT